MMMRREIMNNDGVDDGVDNDAYEEEGKDMPVW